jgi:hypothetical protein
MFNTFYSSFHYKVNEHEATETGSERVNEQDLSQLSIHRTYIIRHLKGFFVF